MATNLSLHARRLAMCLAVMAVPLAALAAPARADNAGNLLSWVNAARAAVGARPLAVDPGLTAVAQQWAAHLATTGVLADNPNLSTQAPSGWTKMGEDVDQGYSTSAIFTFLSSGTSALTTLDPAYDQTGIAVATDPKGQVWVVEEFGDYPPPVAAALSFPANGSTIFPGAQVFSWAQVPGGQQYALTIGTTKGAMDLVNSGILPANQLNYSVPALPGGALWARLFTFAAGSWIYSDASFTVTGATMASFVQPTNGATKVSAPFTFTWMQVAVARYSALSVGTAKGGVDVINTGLLPVTQTSYQAAALPHGKTLWARIYSYVAGTWRFADVSFTTA